MDPTLKEMRERERAPIVYTFVGMWLSVYWVQVVLMGVSWVPLLLYCAS